MSAASDKRGAAARSLIVFKSNPARQMRERSTRSRFRLLPIARRDRLLEPSNIALIFGSLSPRTFFYRGRRSANGIYQFARKQSKFLRSAVSRAVRGISYAFAPSSLRSLAVLSASSDDDDDNLRRRRIGSHQRSRLLQRLLRGGGSAALSHRSVS